MQFPVEGGPSRPGARKGQGVPEPARRRGVFEGGATAEIPQTQGFPVQDPRRLFPRKFAAPGQKFENDPLTLLRPREVPVGAEVIGSLGQSAEKRGLRRFSAESPK